MVPVRDTRATHLSHTITPNPVQCWALVSPFNLHRFDVKDGERNSSFFESGKEHCLLVSRSLVIMMAQAQRHVMISKYKAIGYTLMPAALTLEDDFSLHDNRCEWLSTGLFVVTHPSPCQLHAQTVHTFWYPRLDLRCVVVGKF